MSTDFDKEVLKAQKELDQSLVPLEGTTGGSDFMGDEFLGDLRSQAQDYGQRLQGAASRARDVAGEKFSQASDKLRELQNKDPKELVEDAKQFAREKPGQTILISAAIGMVLGFLLKGRK